MAERIEDLQFNGLSIILDDTLPAFTTDAVLLADFAKVKKNDYVADFGSGSGILPLLMYGRYGVRVKGFEIQKELCDMSNRSFAMNGLCEALSAENTDFVTAYHKYNGVFSALVCNPPYFDKSSNIASDNNARALSRTQSSTNVGDILLAASRVLKSSGKLFMCYPASALTDVLFELRCKKLEPKKLRFVRSTKNKEPYLVLIEAKKDGGRSVTVQNDIVILNDDGSESQEIQRIYHRNTSMS